MKQEYSHLDIFHDGIELNVTNGMDISRFMYTDGRENTIFTQFGQATAKANWHGHSLDVEWKTRQDTTARVRHYQLSEDGQQLYVSEERNIPGQDKPVDIRLVYDRVK